MKKSITLILLIGTIGLLAFAPAGQGTVVSASNTPTPTAVLTEIPDAPLTGMEIWCLPDGVTYAKDAADVQKSDQAVDIAYDAGYTLKGPYSGCFVQLPSDSQYKDAVVAFFDNSNSAAFYKRTLVENEDGYIAIVKHSYLINAPYWQVNYTIKVQAADGTVLFSAPLIYERNWQAERCWNGNMPNPVTYRCPLQLDLHPWDAGYGKPLPTVKPKGD